MEQHISFRKVRDLSGVFSATFAFIKQNFKAVFISLLLFAGPFILIYSTIASVAFGSIFNFSQIKTINPGLFVNFFVAYVLAVVIMLIGISVYNVILMKSVIDNENKEERLTIKSILNGFFDQYWRSFGNLLLLTITTIVFLILLAFFMIAVFTLFFGASTLLGIFLTILLFCASIIYLPILSYIPLAALFVCQRDKIGIFQAIAKVMRYLKSNFWNTWVVSFIAMLTYSSMSMIAQLPVIIVTIINTFSKVGHYSAGEESVSLTLVILTGACSLLSFGVMSIYYLMCIYQFGSLEEKQEGLKVLEKINTI
jgi:hypothetical protein